MILRHRLAALFSPESVLVVRAVDTDTLCSLPTTIWQHEIIYQDNNTDWLPQNVLEERLDLGVICVPAEDLFAVLEQIAAYQPRALLLLTHHSSQSYSLVCQQRVERWAKQHHCLLLGPRSFGLMRPVDEINLSLQPQLVLKGRVALVSQSRTIATAVLDWAEDANIGFSTVVDVGDETDVDLASVLDFLAVDKQSESIILYLHSHPTSRHFASAVYAAAAVKPIIILKAGEQGNSTEIRVREQVFNALIHRAGAIRVRYLIQLFAAVKILSLKRRLKGSRIALVANGAGLVQLALDIMRHGATAHPAQLEPETIVKLEQDSLVNDRLHNPVVRYASWTVDFVKKAISALAQDKQVDGILVLLAPDPYTDLEVITDCLIEQGQHQYKPIVMCLVGEKTMRPLRQRLEQAGIAALRTPDAAMDALNTLASYHQSQQLAQQIIPAYPLGRAVDIESARRLLTSLQQQGIRHVNEFDCGQLLDYFHVPILVQAQPYTLPSLQPASIHVYTDAQYGPYMVFGTAMLNLDFISEQTSVSLPPLNRYLARHFIERSLIWRERLATHAGPDLFRQLQQAVERISELISELPEIKSIQIDPLWLSSSGLYCSKIQMELHSPSVMAMPNIDYQHMAIHPYPRHLIQWHEFPNGKKWLVRPVRPEDAQALQNFVRDLSTESRYMRFVSMMRELSPAMLARYSRIDYSRELALVATIAVPYQTTEEVIAFVHYLRNNDGRGAEYALVVGDAWQRHGIGSQLMRAMMAAAKQQGLSYIDGYVLAENQGMLALLRRLGFKNDIDKYDPGLRRVWLDLHAST